MKATHRIKLVDVRTLLKHEKTSHLGGQFIKLFIDLKVNWVDVVKEGSDYMIGKCRINPWMTTNIQEIKPVIEIPETPFWVEYTSGKVTQVTGGENNRFYDYETGLTRSRSFVSNSLNNGTWTICDEPEKKMIPWSDEDWANWLKDDGVYLSEKDNQIVLTSTVCKETKMFGFSSHLISECTDRHGNKFEKEA